MLDSVATGNLLPLFAQAFWELLKLLRESYAFFNPTAGFTMPIFC